ncbi:hypothetical protein GCM10011571_32350 [Marinithermofilum abyssi]|uniref:Uncharacterized protein n=1 Tax=Marinithermofilum abyssi TaxID=1571185 RepID=A0A8J2VK84_9BACL|nr:hypothetical protein [Marinithermofilum abyssi]GGE27674.1 hypothetical protein GCM10011571_32350 [Marinithermofilum abyssi]
MAFHIQETYETQCEYCGETLKIRVYEDDVDGYKAVEQECGCGVAIV